MSAISLGLIPLVAPSGVVVMDWFSLVEDCSTCLPAVLPDFRLVRGNAGTWCELGAASLTLQGRADVSK